MEIKNFEELRERVLEREPKTVVVACAHDEHSLEAVFRANEDGFLNYILLGKKNEILDLSKKLNHAIDESKVINVDTDEESASLAIEMVREGKADFVQKGIMQTATILRAAVNKQTGIGMGRPMSLVALVDIEKYHKIVGITDGGMVMYPDLDMKKAIISNTVDMFRDFGYEEPKVAALCALEIVNPKMPETVEARQLQEMGEAGEFGKAIVCGPISMDVAVSKEAAEIKKVDNPVAGDSDIMLVPSIYAGNMLVKAMLEFANARMAGVVLGAKCPMAINSRSASFEEKYYSLVACCLMC